MKPRFNHTKVLEIVIELVYIAGGVVMFSTLLNEYFKFL